MTDARGSLFDGSVEKQTDAIHEAIFKIYQTREGVRVGFHRGSKYKKLVAKLKSGSFNVPFFGRKDWIREKIVTNASMYQFIAENIELHMGYKGKLMRWNGYGRNLMPKDPTLSMKELAMFNPHPVLVSIDLEMERYEFEGLLEDI